MGMGSEVGGGVVGVALALSTEVRIDEDEAKLTTAVLTVAVLTMAVLTRRMTTSCVTTLPCCSATRVTPRRRCTCCARPSPPSRTSAAPGQTSAWRSRVAVI